MQLPYFDSSWFIAHRDCSISAVNRFAIAVPERDHLKTPRKQAISTAYRFISVYKQRKRATRSQKQKAPPKYRRVYTKFRELQMRDEPRKSTACSSREATALGPRRSHSHRGRLDSPWR